MGLINAPKEKTSIALKVNLSFLPKCEANVKQTYVVIFLFSGSSHSEYILLLYPGPSVCLSHGHLHT